MVLVLRSQEGQNVDMASPGSQMGQQNLHHLFVLVDGFISGILVIGGSSIAAAVHLQGHHCYSPTLRILQLQSGSSFHDGFLTGLEQVDTLLSCDKFDIK